MAFESLSQVCMSHISSQLSQAQSKKHSGPTLLKQIDSSDSSLEEKRVLKDLTRTLLCSLCGDLYDDPCTIDCSHTFCRCVGGSALPWPRWVQRRVSGALSKTDELSVLLCVAPSTPRRRTAGIASRGSCARPPCARPVTCLPSAATFASSVTS